ncbi:hypothetical protein EJ02DRAFT_183803 [Clathrospora elynae]|uniref:Uncharacterized protein n=1 Tax=Clathrospora elynae TaxID=706981 RepID=A0A6A5SN71_9PLEO|nr:hypothetical protein EJ02DRAFT_183803 [Clathrospora elynae]
MPHNPPQSNALDGWGNENLAAPKPAQQQVHSLSVTVYGDAGPAPQPAYVSTLAPAPMPAPVYHAPQAHPQPQSRVPVHLPPTGGTGDGRALAAEERNKCPHEDTRWPPPNSSIPKPLHLLLGDKPDKLIYYHLIHENDASQAKDWRGEIKSKALAAYASKGLAVPPVSKDGKTKDQLKKVKEAAKLQEVGTAKSAIMSVSMARMLMKEISMGPRGMIWQLDGEHLHVWKCIEVVQKAVPSKAVNMEPSLGKLKFEVFGVGLKGIKGDLLMVSQRVDGP